MIKLQKWSKASSREQEVTQKMTMLAAQPWRRVRQKGRDCESESSGGAESTVTSVLCLHYDPSGKSQRCVDATHACTPVPREALKYSTQHIRRAMRTHTYSCVDIHTCTHANAHTHTHKQTPLSPPVLTTEGRKTFVPVAGL